MVIRTRVRRKFRAESDQDLEESLSPGVTLFGWSHGALVALLAAEKNPRLSPQVVCLCPAGLVQRSPCEIALSYLLGSAISFLKAVVRSDGSAVRLLE